MIKSLRFYKEFTINYFQIFLVINAFQKWCQNDCRSLTLGSRDIFFLDNSTFQKWSQNHCRSLTLGFRNIFFFLKTEKIYFFPNWSQNCCRTLFPSFFQSLFISSSFFVVCHVSIPSCISPYITLSIPVFILLSIAIFIPFFDRQLKLDTFQKSSWNGCRNPS